MTFAQLAMFEWFVINDTASRIMQKISAVEAEAVIRFSRFDSVLMSTLHTPVDPTVPVVRILLFYPDCPNCEG